MARTGKGHVGTGRFGLLMMKKEIGARKGWKTLGSNVRTGESGCKSGYKMHAAKGPRTEKGGPTILRKWPGEVRRKVHNGEEGKRAR